MEIRTMQNIEVMGWMKERLAENIQGMTSGQIVKAAYIIQKIEDELEEFTKCIGDDL